MSIKFNYYYGKEAEQFSFFRIPKLLFTDSTFSKLSSDAKVLYGILLDRMNLSMKNGWLDEENKVYIIFTIEEIAEIMCCATQKATKILQELDKSQFKNDENHNSGNVNFTKQELCKSQCNKTNLNKTEYSDTEYNNTSPISPSKEKIIKDNSVSQKQDTEVEEVIEILKENIEYETVKEQFLSLQKEHINYVLFVLDENKRTITNLRAYLLSLLYNAPVNILGMKTYQEIDATDYSKDKEIWQELFNTT